MIFVGDVAIAPKDKFDYLDFPDAFFCNPICLNLEGAISKDSKIPSFGVCNSSKWKESLKNFQIGPVFIGNNHIHDIEDGVLITKKELEAGGMSTFGAGENSTSADGVVIYNDFVLLGFGWPVIGCKAASKKGPGVNCFDPHKIIDKVVLVREKYLDKKIIVVNHWNYEFEIYPQPAHRKLSMRLIDMGVHAVIGHHPHIVSPVEVYKGKTIAYSLGNFSFSYGKFFDGNLKFPEESFHQISIQIDGEVNTIHHAKFSPPNQVVHQFSEEVGGNDFTLRPEFEGMSDEQYLKWFILNRKKRLYLPIYADFDSLYENKIKDLWVGLRQILIDALVRVGIKSTKRRG